MLLPFVCLILCASNSRIIFHSKREIPWFDSKAHCVVRIEYTVLILSTEGFFSFLRHGSLKRLTKLLTAEKLSLSVDGSQSCSLLGTGSYNRRASSQNHQTFWLPLVELPSCLLLLFVMPAALASSCQPRTVNQVCNFPCIEAVVLLLLWKRRSNSYQCL